MYEELILQLEKFPDGTFYCEEDDTKWKYEEVDEFAHQQILTCARCENEAYYGYVCLDIGGIEYCDSCVQIIKNA